MAARNSAAPLLQLGLISCKVGANPATEKRASNTNICDNGHPITACKQGTYAGGSFTGGLSCPECGGSPTGKARQVGKDAFVKLEAADLEAVAEEAKAFKGVVNLTPHPVEQMTQMLPAADGKVYVLSPYDAAQADNYQLLLALVEGHPEWCYTSMWTVSTVPATYRLAVYQGVLTLQELAQVECIRELPSIGGECKAPMLAMAEQFAQTLVTDFDAATYKDTGRERLDAIVAAGEVVSACGTTSVLAQPDDLMAALAEAVNSAPKAKKPTARKATTQKKAA